ncbi:hypothetical protein [Pseudomonas sp. 34 E 7]|nr:hypothetical protein [Pseudomonas sp. 34 E 7]
MNDPAAVLGQGFSLVGHVQRLPGMTGDFFDAGGHFTRGGGHGAGGLALLLAAARHLMTALAQAFAYTVDLMGIAAHHVDHAAQIALHGGEAANQRTGFVLVARLDNRFAQVAVRDAVGNPAGGAQWPHDAHDHPASLCQQQQEAGAKNHTQDPVGIADRLPGTAAGSLGIGFDQLTQRGHLFLQPAERCIEGLKLPTRRLGVGQGQRDDTLAGADVSLQAGFDFFQAGLDGVVQRQLEIIRQHLPEMLGMLLERGADVGRRAGAFAQPHQHGRQHIGTQGVVHHVGFHMVAQHRHADFIVLHGGAHPGISQVAGQAHDQGGQQPGRNQQHQA